MKKSILTFITLSVCSFANAQQVPNGGFEIWKTTTIGTPPFTVSYDEPEGWQTSNILVGISTNKPVIKTDERASGTFSMLLRNVTFQNATGLDTASGFAIARFKVSLFPQFLMGSYMADIKGPKDTVSILALATRFNPATQKSEGVGAAGMSVTSSQTPFKSFSIPFFGTPGTAPDTITIMISSTGNIKKYRTPGTSFWLDDLTVNNGPLSLIDQQTSESGVRIFPSPASEIFYISNPGNNVNSYKLFNTQGFEVKTGSVLNSGITEIKAEDLSKGLYFIETYDNSLARISKNKIILK